MKTVIILTATRALLGKTENTISDPIMLYPLEHPLTTEEMDLIELNSGLHIIPIHYPHQIKSDLVGGIIDITNPPVNPVIDK